MSAWYINGVFTGTREPRRPAPSAADLSFILLDREVEANQKESK